MKIQSITYRRHVNLGDYNNETFEATAQVEEGEDPINAAIVLRRYVGEEVGLEDQIKDLSSNRDNLEAQIHQLNSALSQAKDRWEKAQAFLKKVGLEIPEVDKDDIPF